MNRNFIPSFSPTEEKVPEREVEEDSDRFMAPTNDEKSWNAVPVGIRRKVGNMPAIEAGRKLSEFAQPEETLWPAHRKGGRVRTPAGSVRPGRGRETIALLNHKSQARRTPPDGHIPVR